MSNSKAIKAVMRELIDLNAKPPAEGIKLIETSELLDIQAWMAGPEETPYYGGCFKIRLVPGPDFPESPPKGFIDTKIFHPNVSPSGEICVNTLKKDWKPDLGIAHVLLTIRCLLIAPNPDSALNDPAAKLLLEDYEAFSNHARIITSLHAFPCPARGRENPFPDLLTPDVLKRIEARNKEIVGKDEMESESVPGVAAAVEGGGSFGGGSSRVSSMGHLRSLQHPLNAISSAQEDAVMMMGGGPVKKRAVLDAGGVEKRGVPLFGSNQDGGGASGNTKMTTDKRKTLKRL
ncbi:hypothetical protein HDU98_006545 [Podochytrium sp. JEL0797]|nr:hypothetical protein HDU98_006545 [Podochytrium sp. JEL0797]